MNNWRIGIPDYGCGSVAVGPEQRIDGRLHRDAAAVTDGGHVPGGAAIGGVVETFAGPARQIRGDQIAFSVDQIAFVRVGDRGNDELGVGGTPGKASETHAGKDHVARAEPVFRIGGSLDQAPRVAAVRGAQDACAVVGIENIVGIAGAREDDPGPAGLHGQGADADGCVYGSAQSGNGVSSRVEDDAGKSGRAGVVGAPHAAAGGADIEMIAGRIRGIERDGGNAAGDQAEIGSNDGGGAQRLPGGAGGGVAGTLRRGCQRPGGKRGVETMTSERAGLSAMAGNHSALRQKALGGEHARRKALGLRRGLRLRNG